MFADFYQSIETLHKLVDDLKSGRVEVVLFDGSTLIKWRARTWHSENYNGATEVCFTTKIYLP